MFASLKPLFVVLLLQQPQQIYKDSVERSLSNPFFQLSITLPARKAKLEAEMAKRGTPWASGTREVPPDPPPTPRRPFAVHAGACSSCVRSPARAFPTAGRLPLRPRLPEAKQVKVQPFLSPPPSSAD